MSIDDIIEAMKAFIASVTPSDGSAPALTDDQAARYADLEAQLKRAQDSESLFARHTNLMQRTTAIPSAQPIVGDDVLSRGFETFLRTGRQSDILARAQSEASGPAGGYLVPDEFQVKLIERRKAFGGLLNAAETVTTATGAPLPWFTNDDTSSTEAGVVAENAQNTFGADLVFGKNALSAYKYDTAGLSGDWLKVSWELLQDSAYDLQGFIARKFAERIQRKVAVDLISGSGVNEPVGIISTMGAVPSSGVTLASATAPTYQELLNIINSLDMAYWEGASFLMSPASYAALQGIVDTTGRPLFWNLNGSLSDSPDNRSLLGYPVVLDPAMPNLTSSSVKWLVFGNLNAGYIVRQVRGFTLLTANELFARNGQVGYLGWERLDGMVQDPNALVTSTSHA